MRERGGRQRGGRSKEGEKRSEIERQIDVKLHCTHKYIFLYGAKHRGDK